MPTHGAKSEMKFQGSGLGDGKCETKTEGQDSGGWSRWSEARVRMGVSRKGKIQGKVLDRPTQKIFNSIILPPAKLQIDLLG